MASKKKLKQFHLFVPGEHYGMMDYTKSFVTVDEAISYVKGLDLGDYADIMQTAEDGSLVDFCYIKADGVVSRSSDGEIWWDKQGKDDHWEERRPAGRLVMSNLPGKSLRQWEVRTEEGGEWQLKEKRY